MMDVEVVIMFDLSVDYWDQSAAHFAQMNVDEVEEVEYTSGDCCEDELGINSNIMYNILYSILISIVIH